MKRYIVFLSCVLVAVPALLQAQTEAEKELLIKQAQAGILQKLTPEQLQAKLKELGLTEEEARRKAKERGLRLEDFITGGKGGGTKIEVAQPGAGAVEVKVPSQAGQGVDTSSSEVRQQVLRELQVQQAQERAGPAKRVETEVGLAKEPGAQELPLFGLSVFQARAESFQPTPSISDKEYVIGSGDALKLSLWGTVEMMNEFTVDSDGRITIPTVGPVFLSGYTLERAKERLMRSMSKSYAGLVESPPTIYMDVSISRLRPVRVFMMGEVSNPGGYYVSNFASVFNSLFAVNGPKQSGSMRQVQLMRNERLMSRVDLYDYLLGATKTGDVRVNDNDLIFVPLRGRTVGIRGEVLRPARYELLPGEQLSRLLEFSGGIHTQMYLNRVQIDRIVPFEQRRQGEFDRRIFDIDFTKIASGKGDFTLEDGDIVTIFPIQTEQRNFVTVDGAVWRPGRFQLEKTPRVVDLILAADSLHPTAYRERADIVRTRSDNRQLLIPIDLNKALLGDPEHNIRLEERDRLITYSIYDIKEPPQTVAIEGAVRHAGTYPLLRNLTLYDLVFQKSGLTDSLYRKQVLLERADLHRLNPDHVTRRTISFNPGRLVDSREGDMMLEPGDRIILFPITALETKHRTVKIFGRVKNPGEYQLTEDMTLLDLLLQSGGYTEDAWAIQGEVSRINRKGLGKDSLVFTRFVQLPDLFDTTKTREQLLESPAGKYRLQDRDEIHIRPNPDFLLQRSVTIEGEVRYPGVYVLTIRNERLSDIVHRAGGLQTSGYARGGSLVRNGQRYRANFEDALDNPKGDEDIILQPGDRLSIPQRPFTVVVQGEVRNPGIYAFVDGKSRNYYIDRAGGEGDSADVALISYPEGYVIKSGLGWLSTNPSIPDGCTITVTRRPLEPPPAPDESKKIDWSATIKDSFAVVASAATIIYLISQVTK